MMTPSNNITIILLFALVYGQAGSTTTNSSTTLNQPFCSHTRECISRVRKMAGETSQFWFGHQWRFNCGGGSGVRHQAGSRAYQHHQVECLNPRELTGFQSLGSRLFRVNTFTQEYLANLRIFPRIHFTIHSGTYRACDHDFNIRLDYPANSSSSVVGVHPLSDPLPSYHTRNLPNIDWSELSGRDSAAYTILMLDVGFGAIKYLAVDYPSDTKVLHAYEPIENFRLHQPTPLVVLIFEQQPASIKALNHFRVSSSDEVGVQSNKLFDLSQFMMDNHLENALIGLNWMLVAGDAYAMERQRLRASIDNCHSLIRQKLLMDRRWKFAESFPLDEMDSTLSVSACCIENDDQSVVFADPLGDRAIPMEALVQSPTVTSLRSLESVAVDGAYQRQSLRRHYITLKDERFTLILFDPHRLYLHWLVTDIASEALATGSFTEETSTLVANYTPPFPKRSGETLFAVFILFRQPRSTRMDDFYDVGHILRSRHCVGPCIYRDNFNVEQFKSFHRLRLSAISWIRVDNEAKKNASSMAARSGSAVHRYMSLWIVLSPTLWWLTASLTQLI